MKFTSEQLRNVKTRDDFINLAKEQNLPISKILKDLKYESDLQKLQSELLSLQKWISKTKKRVVIIF